jgi:hypothetical protein
LVIDAYSAVTSPGRGRRGSISQKPQQLRSLRQTGARRLRHVQQQPRRRLVTLSAASVRRHLTLNGGSACNRLPTAASAPPSTSESALASSACPRVSSWTLPGWATGQIMASRHGRRGLSQKSSLAGRSRGDARRCVPAI